MEFRKGDFVAGSQGATAAFEGQSLRIVGNVGVTTRTLAIRPEDMALELMPPTDGNAIRAQLRDLTYMGADTRLDLLIHGQVPLTLSLPAATLPPGHFDVNQVTMKQEQQ